MRGVEDDRRGVEQPELASSRAIAASTTPRRAAVAAVRPVRSDRHGVEVRSSAAPSSERSRRAQASASERFVSSPSNDDCVATPADLSPIPHAEAPRDCPLCPRLVAFRAANAARSIRTGGTRRCRRSAIRTPGWRLSAWLRASMAQTAPGGPSPAIMRASCSTRRCEVRVGRGRVSARPGDGLRLNGAVILNAVKCLPPANKPRAARDHDLPQLFRGGAGGLPTVRVSSRWARSPTSPPRGRSACRRLDEIRPRRESIAPDGRIRLSSYHCSPLQPEHGPARRGDVRERVRTGARAQMSSVSRP